MNVEVATIIGAVGLVLMLGVLIAGFARRDALLTQIRDVLVEIRDSFE